MKKFLCVLWLFCFCTAPRLFAELAPLPGEPARPRTAADEWNDRIYLIVFSFLLLLLIIAFLILLIRGVQSIHHRMSED